MYLIVLLLITVSPSAIHMVKPLIHESESDQSEPESESNDTKSDKFMIYEMHIGSDVDGVTPIEQRFLVEAYPNFLESVKDNILRWKDGTEMLFDDGIKDKDYHSLLNSPDIEDQLSMPYPIGRNYTTPFPKNFEPGRIRYEPFFLKMYGNSAKEVQSKLVAISWLPTTLNKRILVTSVNNVHEKLQAVSNELDRLSDDLKKYVTEISGTFNWRKISGTERLSVHSFGIAIDINIKYSNYWKWDTPNPEDEQAYRNQIPIEIVEIFEKHGFIWGGKWYHYDTMHFEYRPELLIESEYLDKEKITGNDRNRN